MTRERAKELWPVIQAYSKGEVVEAHPDGEDYWYPCICPSWLDDHHYRIKPWTPPPLPPHLAGREWHRPIKACWEDGKRAMLVGEVIDDEDECFDIGNESWGPPECASRNKVMPLHWTFRTARPFPEPQPELVPLENGDIRSGDSLCVKDAEDTLILRIDGRKVWFLDSDGDTVCRFLDELMVCGDFYRKAGMTEWLPCHKVKEGAK